jgi:hypothetical protein
VQERLQHHAEHTVEQAQQEFQLQAAELQQQRGRGRSPPRVPAGTTSGA